ncbi:hypothetical protein MRX96_027644 [Rhipicephalus microplus]
MSSSVFAIMSSCNFFEVLTNTIPSIEVILSKSFAVYRDNLMKIRRSLLRELLLNNQPLPPSVRLLVYAADSENLVMLRFPRLYKAMLRFPMLQPVTLWFRMLYPGTVRFPTTDPRMLRFPMLDPGMLQFPMTNTGMLRFPMTDSLILRFQMTNPLTL